MKQYYQDLITEKSWQFLQELKKTVAFVLIGGWAVYLYTNRLKSKDIDIIVDYDTLVKLKKLGALTKNQRLLKYELKEEAVSVDIYLPYYSVIGLPVEAVIQYTTDLGGFVVLQKEMLIITKLAAYAERKASTKGQKDKLDVLALLFLTDFDYDALAKIVTTHHKKILIDTLLTILQTSYEAPELGLARHQFAKLKKRALTALGSMR